ncbi:hypothetical protein BGX38DRAFT_1104609, partial [Terfezia claveryi]
PLFMTIGNIHSEIQNQPTRQVWIRFYDYWQHLLRNSESTNKTSECDALRVQHQIVSYILAPLIKKGGSDIFCRDGKVRKCILVLSPWLADHMENVNIYGIKTNRCPMYIISS